MARRILDWVFAVGMATPPALLLYLSIEATPFGAIAVPLAIASWAGIIYEVVKKRNGDA
ncbi:MAG: hypothetical protein IH933_13895 [Euryarchaeota archaeon]|nr:hypothetical protein [Euryarchaeota archaeon]